MEAHPGPGCQSVGEPKNHCCLHIWTVETPEASEAKLIAAMRASVQFKLLRCFYRLQMVDG